MTLTGERLLDLIKRIGQTLEQHRIPYALSGAMANLIWGVPRATKDVDLLLTVPRIQLPNVLGLLFEPGCQGDLQQALKDSVEQYCIRLSYEGILIEIFLPYLPYHQEVIRRRVQREVDGIPLWFVTAEDLIILKLLFYRTKDIADIKAIVATQTDRLDRAYLTSTLQKLLPANDPRHRELAQWLQPP